MEKKQTAKKVVKKAAKKTTKKKAAKKITKKRTAKKVDEGKTVNLQGTAKMKVNVTAYGRQMAQYGRQMAEGSKPVQPVVNIVNMNAEVKMSPEQKAKFHADCHDILRNARRIQSLPDDMRHDTLKPEYQTRTARAIAAIRHTVNNLATCFANIWHWNG